jgi:hypothetical protein
MENFCNLFSRLSKAPRKFGQARNQTKAPDKFPSTGLLDSTERRHHPLHSFTAVEIRKTKESQRSLSIPLAWGARLAYLNEALLQGPSGPSNFYSEKSFLSIRSPELGRWSRNKVIELYIVSHGVIQYIYFKFPEQLSGPGVLFQCQTFTMLIRWHG